MPTGAETPRALETASPVEFADYFTYDEFGELTGDTEAGGRAQPPAVMRAQAEVVERLEEWARTAWRRRTYTEAVRLTHTRFALSRVPVISVQSANLDGSAMSGYVYDANGVVRFGVLDNDLQVLDYLAVVDVSYTYGYDSVPWAIKRPCIDAARSLLWRSDPESNIPANTESYTNQGTTIRFAPTSESEMDMPWPWAPDASREVRSYWGPKRPRRFIVGV